MPILDSRVSRTTALGANHNKEIPKKKRYLLPTQQQILAHRVFRAATTGSLAWLKEKNAKVWRLRHQLAITSSLRLDNLLKE